VHFENIILCSSRWDPVLPRSSPSVSEQFVRVDTESVKLGDVPNQPLDDKVGDPMGLAPAAILGRWSILCRPHARDRNTQPHHYSNSERQEAIQRLFIFLLKIQI